MCKKFCHSWLFALLFSFWILTAFSNCGSKASATTVVSVSEGDVQVKTVNSTNWVKADSGVVLNQEDIIKTGTDSRVTITFFDGSVLELESNTQVEITEMTNGKSTNILLKQEIGKTLNRVKKLVDPAARYEIETPAAVIAVRGTQMIVKVAVNGTTTAQNIEGKISVTAQGVEVPVSENQIITVEPGQPPSAPENITTTTTGPVVLTVTKGTQTKTYTMTELKSLPFITGYSGSISQSGIITGPMPYKGVALTDLLNELGGLPTGSSVIFTAKDGYTKTLTYEQIIYAQDSFTTYDLSGKVVNPETNLIVFLAYEADGKALDNVTGPVELAVMTNQNQLTDGYIFIRQVDKIEIVLAP